MNSLRSITIPSGRTCNWNETRRFRGSAIYHPTAGWSPPPFSTACTTATIVWRDWSPELPFSRNIPVINLGLRSQRKLGVFGQFSPCFFSEQPSSRPSSRHLDSNSDPFVFRLVGMVFSVGTGLFGRHRSRSKPAAKSTLCYPLIALPSG